MTASVITVFRSILSYLTDNGTLAQAITVHTQFSPTLSMLLATAPSQQQRAAQRAPPLAPDQPHAASSAAAAAEPRAIANPDLPSKRGRVRRIDPLEGRGRAAPRASTTVLHDAENAHGGNETPAPKRPRRDYRCRRCGSAGHNSRRCHLPNPNPDRSQEPEEELD